MRIRKRQVPLPLSSLSPIPLSDLQVQLQPCTPPPPDKTRTSLTGGPNHQTKPPIGNQFTNETAAQDRAKLVVDGDGVGSEEEQLGGDSSGSVMGESIIIESGLSSSSHQVGGSYYDGERAFPLKERSLIFEMEEKDKKRKKMRSLKAKVNKKCNDEEDEDYRETMMEGNAKRKGNRGNVLMEGSRCSRVNGRGWRCCQPTLVGYSLCEHHLGKGRLRSVMTVKTRVAKSNKRLLPSNSSKTAKLERIDEADDDDDGSDEHKVALIMSGGAKKMMKIGLVKARSMSSLLSQVDPKNGGAGSGVNAEEASDGKESSG